jgi:2-C-methyl-D-erythritol 2,4-cyclodiphosphate synthase
MADTPYPIVRTGLGQDSHRFEAVPTGKVLRLAGLAFENEAALEGNSDADVVLHALCNALTGVHGVVVLGKRTDELCQEGVTDSAEYVKETLEHLGSLRLSHVSVSLECLKPKIAPQIGAMRQKLAELLKLDYRDVAITAHTGEGLTAFGRGEGIFATVIVTAQEDYEPDENAHD